MFTFCNTFNSSFLIAFFNGLITIDGEAGEDGEEGNDLLEFCKNTADDKENNCFDALKTQI